MLEKFNRKDDNNFNIFVKMNKYYLLSLLIVPMLDMMALIFAKQSVSS